MGKASAILLSPERTGMCTLTTHLSRIWEGLRAAVHHALLRAITALQGKLHCCQQTRLMIWWGVNIFHVTVCKHGSFHPSPRSVQTLLCIYMSPFSSWLWIFCACPFQEFWECADQGPCWTSELISEAHHIFCENVNRQIHILCQCVRLPSSQYELHRSRPEVQEVTVGEGLVVKRHIC